MQEVSSSDTTSSSDLIKLSEIEIQETSESFRWFAGLLLRVATVLSIANLTAIGYAAANKQAGMFFLGAGITMVLLIAYRAGFLGAVPMLCRLIALEDDVEFLLHKPLETSISLTLLNILGPEFLDVIRDINKMSDPMKKQRAMRKAGQTMFIKLSTGRGTLILMLAILIQVALAPIFVLVFHWKLF